MSAITDLIKGQLRTYTEDVAEIILDKTFEVVDLIESKFENDQKEEDLKEKAEEASKENRYEFKRFKGNVEVILEEREDGNYFLKVNDLVIDSGDYEKLLGDWEILYPERITEPKFSAGDKVLTVTRDIYNAMTGEVVGFDGYDIYYVILNTSMQEKPFSESELRPIS